VLRNAWQVESRLAGHGHSIAAAVATMRGHNAGDAVGIQRAGLSEVNLILFPRTPFPRWLCVPVVTLKSGLIEVVSENERGIRKPQLERGE
jgi:hypothetical protein